MKTLVALVAGLLAFPLIVALVGIAGYFPSNAIQSPPGWESSVGMRALDASLEKRASGLKNPIGPTDGRALAAGAKIYANNCAGCHGDAKSASNWGANGFYPRVPQFWQRKKNDLTPEEAYAAIRDGVRYSGMGAWRDLMTEDDMWKVANFVATTIHADKAKPKS